MRSIRVLVALAFVTLALAGCVSPASLAPGSAPVPAATLPALDLKGAAAGAHNASSATFTWKANAPLAVSTVVGPGGISPGDDSVTLDVPAPAGILFAINVTLKWKDDADLDLYVLDAKGQTKCASAKGNGMLGGGGSLDEQCETRMFQPLESAASWKIRVLAYDTHRDATPFEATIRYEARPAMKFLGPAIAPLAAGATRALQYAAPVLVSKNDHSGEPSIAVDAQDVVYYAAPVGAQSALYRSKDGKSFEPVKIQGTPPFPIGGGDSDVAVDGTKDVYFADLSGACNTVSSSHDAGATWFNQPLACDLPVVDRQWLATDGPDKVWLAFNGRHGATVVGSIDGGKTFPIRAYVPEKDFCARGNLVHSKADGLLYLAGCDSDGPGVGVSADGGITWSWSNAAKRSGKTTTGFCYTCHIFSVADVDEKGNLYLVWSDESAGTLDVWMVTSKDKAKTWSEPVKVNQVKGTHVQPWIAAGKEGHVVVVWYGTLYQGAPDKATGEWYAQSAVSHDALAAAPTFSEALVSTEPVQYGPICMNGSGCSSGRNLLDFFEVALDSHGAPRVAYVDGRAGGNARNSLLMYAQGTA